MKHEDFLIAFVLARARSGRITSRGYDLDCAQFTWQEIQRRVAEEKKLRVSDEDAKWPGA